MEKNRLKGFLTFLLFAIIMAFSVGTYAQQKQITGKVSDESGAPVPGVTIAVKGTTMGTITDMDGSYTMSVPANAVLIFSYIGMKPQEVVVGAQSNINVSMQADVIGLEEVIAVGYATRRQVKKPALFQW
jgi:hypothetical protein